MRRTLPLLLLALSALAQAQTAKPGEACRAEPFRAFDFWVGEWDVYGPKGNQVGRSSISKILGDCVIDEFWRGGGGVEGRSHNMYDQSTSRWTQFWVDNSGSTLLLHGGIRDGAMVLEGGGANNRQRITWSKLEGGAVRQLWESSTDDGKTWTVAFDGRYQPTGSPPPVIEANKAP